jgi:DnaJ-class molecular chaperone
MVETPRDLTAAQQELLRQYAEARGEQITEPESGGDGVFSRLRSAFG